TRNVDGVSATLTVCGDVALLANLAFERNQKVCTFTLATDLTTDGEIFTNVQVQRSVGETATTDGRILNHANLGRDWFRWLFLSFLAAPSSCVNFLRFFFFCSRLGLCFAKFLCEF